MKLREAFRRATAPFRPGSGRRTLVAGPEALRLEWQERGRPRSVSWRWADVERAVAFKRDLGGLDLICLALEAQGEALEIDEEMEGWHELLGALPERLPGCLDGRAIFAAVVHAPFAASETVVYARGAPA